MKLSRIRSGCKSQAQVWDNIFREKCEKNMCIEFSVRSLEKLSKKVDGIYTWLTVTVKDLMTSTVAVVKEFRSKSHCCSFGRQCKSSMPPILWSNTREHRACLSTLPTRERKLSRYGLIGIVARFSLGLLIIWIANS